MNFLKTAICGIVLGAALAASPANAATYLWTYTDTSNAVVASGTLVTDAAAGVSGDVTSITGLVLGDAITGLIPNLTAPVASISPDGLWIFDNNLNVPSPPFVTNPGLLFQTASMEYNLFSDSPSQYELWGSPIGSGQYGTDILGTFSVTAVPEPAAWALMLFGFLTFGTMLRARSRKLGALAA